MKFELKSKTSPEWAAKVLENFDAFLLDHASCERKAAALCMSFVVKYPDKPELVEDMIRTAREELEHFYQVYRIIRKRGLLLGPDEKDPYINALMEHVSTDAKFRLLDRLLMSGLVEARGCERFYILSDVLEDPQLKSFYLDLAKAEARHESRFLELALAEYPRELVEQRLEFWLEQEALIVATLSHRYAVH